MNSTSYPPPHMESLKKSPPCEGHSSGSDSKKNQTPGAKKRPSRAGTRGVTTLTAAQLERKRANDREAQRAIRQRTKDHIESLERQVRDLTSQLDTSSSAKMLELMRRNEELEQENAVLRARLSHAVSALGVPEQSGGSAPSPSDRIQMLSQPRRSSTETSRSVHSVPEMATPVSQPGYWQPHHAVSLPIHPNPYGNSRAMSYPLETTPLVTSLPMQMTGYGTPTSHPSPHPSDYQRHMSVPMNPPLGAHPHAHPQQQTPTHYSYPGPAPQGYVGQTNHPGEIQIMTLSPHA